MILSSSSSSLSSERTRCSFRRALSVGFRLGLPGGFERLTAAAVGVATVCLVYELGRLLYGRNAGLLAALLMALMPYHVVVTRQVLLDGPMTLFATLTLVLLARFAQSGRPASLYAAGGAMGLTFLSKETSIVLLGAIYAFLALTPQLRVRIRDLAVSMGLMGLVIAPFPLTLMLAGRTGTGESYLTWQLFRRPNHDWLFYPHDRARGRSVRWCCSRPAWGSGCCAVSRRGGRRCSCAGSRYPWCSFSSGPSRVSSTCFLSPPRSRCWPLGESRALIPAACAGRGDSRRQPARPDVGEGCRRRLREPFWPGPEAFRRGARRASGSTPTSRTGRPS